MLENIFSDSAPHSGKVYGEVGVCVCVWGNILHSESSLVKSGYCHEPKNSPGKAGPLLWSCGTQPHQEKWGPGLLYIALAAPITLQVLGAAKTRTRESTEQLPSENAMKQS